MPGTSTPLDTAELERQIKTLYAQVALRPETAFHFPTGRSLAQRLGYPADLLDRIPAAALASFAGVGNVFDLAKPVPGERVLDLGSGSGTDTFAAAALVSPAGSITGVDMSEEQLAKAARLGDGIADVRFTLGRLEDLPFPDSSFDLVISNGVINLCPDKRRVFSEAARVLVPDGRLSIADIVAARPMPESVTSNADLWSACIGGATPESEYRTAIGAAGLAVTDMREVPEYQFLTERARNASATYGVRAITLLARHR